ncbi:peptidylprolyl isomerase [Spirosoma aerophilum]
MKLCLLALLFLAGEVPYSLYGQVLPETNNKRHYSDVAARKEAAFLYRKVKVGYPFDKLAVAYSQDYGSYAMGGKLGWQKTNQFVPVFADVVSQMTPGQISKPFKTEFGYHIVQLIDRREGEVLTRHLLLKTWRYTNSTR